MYLSKLSIYNFRCFDDNGIEVNLRPGLTALVGENDAGKTAIIDAVRYVLGTSDQEWIRVNDSDFHNEDTTSEIRIVCRFDELSAQEKGAFLEYLTYEDDGKGNKSEVLLLTWTATKIMGSREFTKTEIRSGKQADGPVPEQAVKELMRATYLRPLRDADNTLSAGKNSRLSQVLRNIEAVKQGDDEYAAGANIDDLSVAGIAHLANGLLSKHDGIANARTRIDTDLKEKMLLTQENLQSRIDVSGSADGAERRRQLMLEKLNLDIERTQNNKGKLGLGTNNVLYMACELLLLDQANTGNRMLLIEEPEAHLHAQRQLKIMKSLQKEADDNGVQVLISTHSPLLASALKVENLVMLQSGKAFSLAKAHTKLSALDYRFLERFLDATKANLFFAKGVVIVEGDAENILFPAIARILGRDFSDYGISVVNVGGTGLRRYSNIFLREDEEQGIIDVPVACITDMDVMPNCAPEICLTSITSSDPAKWPKTKDRRWRALSDFKDGELDERRKQINEKCDGQKVKSFIADHWTLEYDLAREGLGEEVYIAAKLAIKDEQDVPAADSVKQVGKDAIKYHADNLIGEVDDVRASKIYSEFTTGTKASKSIAAQYLACLLENRYGDDPASLADKLPPYVKCAIEHVTGGPLVLAPKKNAAEVKGEPGE